MSSDFYTASILPYAAIIIKLCRAYTDTQEDFEDYYQEVCLQIRKCQESFQQQAEWSTWIYRLSLNVCLTLLKKKKTRSKYVTPGELPEQATVDRGAFADEAINQLYVAIRRLSELYRAVILLYLEEKSYQEIADITGTNPNNIGVRINRIKERLRRLY